MRMNFSIPVISLIAGAALGYCARAPREAAEVKSGEGEASSGTALIANAGEDALRARIAELEAQLAAKGAEGAKASDEESSEEIREERVTPEERRARHFKEMREGFEKWRKENPEEFAKMEQRRKEWQTRRRERARSRREFLSSVDTSRMTDDERDAHDQLQTLMQRREELETKMSAMTPFENEEEFGSLVKQLHEVDHEMRDLNRVERETLLKATAEELGYAGDDAAIIVDTVKEVIEATSEGRGGPGGPGPGGPGPREGRGK